MLELLRYIVLNPVRAGLVSSAGDWPWSSYRGVMGKAMAPAALPVDAVLALFSTDRGAARRGFHGLLLRAWTPTIRPNR
ncbi:MAG: hypothetical protein COS34_07150 [Lysobacterales bacterium CG02_land_8_20_14_3_00_62_12]|nr:MAG: hypothetical protein COS34_07150 [Xanthomonadales bacterium CG02_land_8_20_14_3_00_62_12]PJA41759.1 MAG: hypothetical protein CO182_05735 [Xanthomonadales bacterium CG_4_9_14_3_um_filter_62_6]